MNIQLNPSSEYFLNSLGRMQSRFETVQRQATSGIRVEKPSDAPARIADILGRETTLVRSQQVRDVLGRVGAETNAAEQALQRAVAIVQRALVIGTRTATDLSDSSTQFEVFAEELEGLHDELVRLSRTTVEGRFIFGGDLDQEPPYQVNSLSPNGNGVDRLTQASSTKLALDIDGSRFSTGRTAEQIFDLRDPGDVVVSGNAFAAVSALLVASQAEDPAASEAALADLEAAHDHLNGQLSFYGTVQNRVAAGVSQSYRSDVRVQAELSEIRDTDVAAAAVEMARLQNGIQVAIQSQSTFRTPTLFDFLR